VLTFAASGAIALSSPLQIPSNVSLDGVGVDVTLLGKGLVVADVQDVIVSPVTVADTGPDSEDGVQILRASDVVLDHVTFVQTGANNNVSSRFVDEAVSVVLGTRAVTIEHCPFDHWKKRCCSATAT
jgi:pectate lyase